MGLKPFIEKHEGKSEENSGTKSASDRKNQKDQKDVFEGMNDFNIRIEHEARVNNNGGDGEEEINEFEVSVLSFFA